MEGSGDDPGAPESWEMADLDETMGHLVVSSPSSNNKSSTSSPPSEDPFEEPPATAVVKASARTYGGVSEDVINQVDQFLREALQNPRERLSVLRMEQDIEKFIRDPRQQQLEFQHFPTSYLRLAAHRVAQHYYLQSMVALDNSSPDGSGSRIVVYKTSECRLPPIRLADIPVNLPQEDSSSGIKLAIKPRPLRRSQAIGGAGTHSSRANHLKSVEERKEEYNRARARIFNGSGSIRGGSVNIGGPGAKSDSESALPDGFQPSSLVLMREEEKSHTEVSDSYISRVSSDSSSGSSRSNRSREEKDPVNRFRGSNKVAIFRDREVDRKDPDYDRNYDRYMQRFDPGFGFNRGLYTIQPLYAPAVNYNTEFPQLGMNQRPHMSIDHHPRLVPQHMRGPWPGMSGPSAIGHGPPEASMPPFNPNPFGGHSSAVYLHSSQYAVAPRPGMAYVHPHDHAHQNFTQTHQQQPEASFGLARPH